MNKSILKLAGLHALGTALYVVLVALFLNGLSIIFRGKPDNEILAPIAMLLLFVLSASITGSLVLGRPILWYLDGKKKDAITLFVATIGFLFLLTVIAFLGLSI